ncbi:MAG: hypothetical protein JKY56_04010, partial [Kofleriaceae bacterium]|nr:hypothetical protein [Kofleriaceae bacterium]
NCFLSPGTEFCSLSALTNELPTRDLGGSLVCDDVSVDVLERDPNSLLLDTDVSIPRNFYRKMWLERRYPEGETVGSLGTYSLGGIVPNGIYVVSDSLKYFENLMRNLRNPVEYFAAKCTGNWDSPECEMSRKVGTFYAILAGAIAVLYGVGALLALIPFAGPFLAAPFLFAASFISATLILLRDHMLPGITLPIAGMRGKLKRHLDENWVDHVMVTSQRMAGESCANTCGEFAEEDSTCVEHRLLGISGYLDWAEEAFDIVDSLDCNDNNYFRRVLSGDMNVEDWYDMALSGGTIVATQYMSCLVADYFYENHFREGTIGKLAGLIRKHTTEQICGFVNFYEPLADENGIDVSESACKQTLETLFSGSGASDDRELLVRLKDLIGILDVGMTEDQRQTLYAQLNSLLARTAGIQVDFDRLHQLQIALDCSVGLDIDYGDIITTFNAREVLINAMDSFTDDGDPDTVTSGEEAVDSIDRAFGFYDEQQGAIDAVNQNLANSAFAPIDVNRFSPMYNTIALNKLILLGSGSDRCETLERECQGDNPPPGCGDCGSDDVGTATKEFPDSGIFDLVKKANRTRFSEAYDAAYSTEQLDQNPSTYLQSFFQEQFVEEGSWRGCERTGFNIACGAIYSIDDPKDYCQSLDSWDPGYLTRRYTDAIGDNESDLDSGILIVSGEAIVTDCAFALADIDTSGYRGDRKQYAPNPRFRIGPSEDPRNSSYTQSIAANDYLSVENHRSTVLDRVIRQSVPERISIRDLLNWVETAPTRIWAFVGSWFGTSEEPTPSAPQPENDYYPHALTRFSIANKDTHVSRLYSKLFAPFYCAEAHGSDQKDSDCDSVPDACDNCPFTYNPDQLDSNLDSIGDDCTGFDPFTFPLTPTPSSKVDIRCEDSGSPDLEVARPELSDLYTAAKN